MNLHEWIFEKLLQDAQQYFHSSEKNWKGQQSKEGMCGGEWSKGKRACEGGQITAEICAQEFMHEQFMKACENLWPQILSAD